MKINGTPVADATRKVVIEITASDIRKGDNKDPASCAAAKPASANCTQQRRAFISGARISSSANKWVRFNTSKALRTEIVAFDRGGEFAPGTYELNPVTTADQGRTRKGQKSHSERKYNGRVKKNKKTYHVVTGIRPHGANR